MKMTSKLAILALALTAGVASAAPVAVGTKITNQASVDFTVTDPTTTTQTTGHSDSNIVTTTITAQPSFTIKQDTGDSSLIQAKNAGDTGVTYPYVVTNTGNTPIVVNLSDIANSTTYASDATPNNITLSTGTVTLQPGGTANVTMKYDIPATNPAKSYGRDLSGTATYDPNWKVGDTFAPANATSNVVDANGNQVVDKDNENHTTVTDPKNITPYHPGTGSTTLPEDPNNSGITPSTDPKNPDGTGPGYTAPDGTPVYVDPTTGTQTAYPKADTNDTNPDSVTIPSGATNNTGTNQNITVGPATDPDGTGPITVTIVDPSGNPFHDGDPVKDVNGNTIPGATVTTHPDGSVTFNNVPSGYTPAYDVKITYPDTDGTGAVTTPVEVTVPVTNSDGTNVANPKFEVKPPNAQFANSNGSTLGVDATAVDKAVTPTTTGDVYAVFPMDVYNNGTYTDTYNISGTTTVPGGSVAYYSTAADAAAGTNPITSVGAIAPGAEQTVYAGVKVPANTAAGKYTTKQNITSPTSNIVRNYDNDTVTVGIVQQPANTITDPADPNYTSNPLFPLNKKVDPATAKPGDVLTYDITGTNKYNVPTCANIFKELDGTNTNIFANSAFQSVSGSASTGNLVYSTDDGATWSATSPAAGATKLWVGINTNSDNTVDNTDCLPIGGNVAITLKMKVN